MTWTISFVTHELQALDLAVITWPKDAQRAKCSMIQAMMLKAFPTKDCRSLFRHAFYIFLHSLSHFMTFYVWHLQRLDAVTLPGQETRPHSGDRWVFRNSRWAFQGMHAVFFKTYSGLYKTNKKRWNFSWSFKNCFGFFSMLFLRQAAAWIRWKHQASRNAGDTRVFLNENKWRNDMKQPSLWHGVGN